MAVPHSISGAVDLSPGQQQTLHIPLVKRLSSDLQEKFFGMRGYPGGYDEEHGIDTAKINQLVIFVDRTHGRTCFRDRRRSCRRYDRLSLAGRREPMVPDDRCPRPVSA